MPLHPAPTIDAGLCLVTQPITRSDTSRIALLTFALESTLAHDVQTIANDFQTHFNARFGPNFDTECTIQKPLVSEGNGSNVPHQAVGAGAAINGSNTDPVPPSQVALLLKKNTGLGGKKNRGRSYFPWFVSSLNVSETGVVSNAEIVAIQALATAFLADLVTAGIPMAIANRVMVLTPPDTRPHVTEIHGGPMVTSYVVEPVVATQRRRLRG